MTSHNGSDAARLVALVTATPGISIADLVDQSGIDRAKVARTMLRYERAGHVSSDTIGRVQHYWVERPTTPTQQGIIRDLLAKGPASWGDIFRVCNGSGVAGAVTALIQAGVVVVEARTVTKDDGRTVRRPNVYRLA
jgi:hypothetical protein